MIYLNYAALSPTEAKAEHETKSAQNEFNQYLYSEYGIQWYLEKIQNCRIAVSNLLNIEDPAAIAFVPNASTAHYFAINTIGWNSGDSILTTTHENPSITRQLHILMKKGVHVHTVRPSEPNHFVNSMKQLADRHQPKVIVVSHVSHVDGRILPIQEIANLARDRNIIFFIDGAQSVGHIPVDLSQLDFDIYFFTGHKWCGGPLGTGALVMHDHFLELNPTFGIQVEKQGRLKATQFEIGTHNIGLTAGLAKACEIKLEEGLGSKKLRSLRQQVKNELGRKPGVKISEWEGPHAPGILTFQGNASMDHQYFTRRLSVNWNIAVKSFLDYPQGEVPAIRLSWSQMTKEKTLRFAIRKIIEELDTDLVSEE